jgi:hypothetical protein
VAAEFGAGVAAEYWAAELAAWEFRGFAVAHVRLEGVPRVGSDPEARYSGESQAFCSVVLWSEAAELVWYSVAAAFRASGFPDCVVARVRLAGAFPIFACRDCRGWAWVAAPRDVRWRLDTAHGGRSRELAFAAKRPGPAGA